MKIAKQAKQPLRNKVRVEEKAPFRRTEKHRRSLLTTNFRRWFFRYFQQWYCDNQHRFAIPLFLYRHRDRGICVSVGDIPGEKMYFGIFFRKKDFQDGSLFFSWGEENIDSMAWMETYPKRIDAGYICELCREFGKDLRVFPTRESLWEDHIFEVILETVNEKIAAAEHIELRFDDGASFAKFVMKEEVYTPSGKMPIVDVIQIHKSAALPHLDERVQENGSSTILINGAVDEPVLPYLGSVTRAISAQD